MLTWPKVLLLNSDDAESTKWQEMFREYASLERVRDLDELHATLRSDNYDALFCGWRFEAGTWHEALEEVRQNCPDMPVIVFSSTADEREWIEVLEAGGFDLLATPYHKRTVLPVLEQAVLSYEARRFHNTASITAVRAS